MAPAITQLENQNKKEFEFNMLASFRSNIRASLFSRVSRGFATDIKTLKYSKDHEWVRFSG
jgi:hypothetical protein